MRSIASVASVAATLADFPGRIVATDLSGAAVVFAINVLAVAPVLVPFLIVDDACVAIRASNAILVLLLFIAGRAWAGQAGTHRVVTGIGVMTIGIALVGVAVALGG